jgi:Carbohydrate-binding family 9
MPNLLTVKKTQDFELTGKGDSTAWANSEWHPIVKHKGETAFETKFKILYSTTGIYCLYFCEDEIVKSTIAKDNADLWTEDVVEAFFWPDERWPVYFEYELSPNNKELPILVPNFNGNFHGWLPWGDQPSRQTRHATHVQEKNGNRQNWTAEFFIPFEILKPLQNVLPASGSRWRANFYRIDHDCGVTQFAWSPVQDDFHEYQNFGILEFE